MKKFLCIFIAIICLFGSNAYAWNLNTTIQKVELYYSVEEADRDMNKHIENGWLIHSFDINTLYERRERILVVYEKERVLIDYEPEQR